MKLELLSLRAVNCGPLKDVLIDFSDGNGHARPITLLAGANGSGKTTVLELITALAELLLLETVSEPELSGHGRVEPQYPKPKNILGRTEFARMELLVDGNRLTLAYGQSPADEEFTKDSFFYLAPKGRFLYQVLKQGAIWQDIQSKITEQSSSGLSFSGLNAKTDYAANMLPTFLLFPHYRALTKIDAVEVLQADYFFNWVYKYAPANTLRESLDSYIIWLDYSDPDEFALLKDVFAALFSQKKSLAIDRKRLKVVVDLGNGDRHDLIELSSGEQNLLITLIEMRRRLVPGSIIMIDELENSLHPAFQHRMAQGLLQLQREIPFQLIVTTHAKAFVDVLGVQNTLILTEY